MSKLTHGVFSATPEPDKRCAFCGDVADTRPYGPGWQEICMPCAQKPQYKAIVEGNYAKILLHADYVVDTRRKPQ